MKSKGSDPDFPFVVIHNQRFEPVLQALLGQVFYTKNFLK